MLSKVKNGLCSTRTVYMLCFWAISVIDWTRNSQAGGIWYTTVNLTGVVVGIMLLEYYGIRAFRRNIYAFYTGLCVVIIIGTRIFWESHQAMFYRDQVLSALLNVWILGMFTIRLIYAVLVDKTEKIRISGLEILAYVCLILMLISVNEDIWPVWFLIMFGLLYRMNPSEERKNEMMHGMLNGIIWSFFVIHGHSFVLRPYDRTTYSAMFDNKNMLGLFFTVTLFAVLCKFYLVKKEDGKKVWKILFWLMIPMMFSFILFSLCRTAFLSAVALLMVFLVFADGLMLKEKLLTIGKRFLAGVVITAVLFPVIYLAHRYIPPVFHHPIWFPNEYYSESALVHSWDPWDSEKYITFDEVVYRFCKNWHIPAEAPVVTVPRVKNTIPEVIESPQKEEIISRAVMYYEDGNVTGETTVKVSLQAFASDGKHAGIEVGDESVGKNGLVDDSAVGRIYIFKAFISNLNLKGHKLSESNFSYPNGTKIWHAQNELLQIAYLYGIFAAVFYVAIVILLAAKSIKEIRKGNRYGLFTLMFLAMRLTFGLLEVTWYPGQTIVFLLFWLPLFIKKEEQYEENSESFSKADAEMQ